MKTIFDKIYILHWLPNKDRDIALKKKFKYCSINFLLLFITTSFSNINTLL